MYDLIVSPKVKRLLEYFAENGELPSKVEPESEQFNLNGYLINMISPAKDKYKSFIKYIYLIKLLYLSLAGEIILIKYPFKLNCSLSGSTLLGNSPFSAKYSNNLFTLGDTIKSYIIYLLFSFINSIF